MNGRYPEEIYSGRITAYERKWFFFDVKKSKDGTRRLVITESYGPKSTQDRTSITVAEGDLADFLRGLLSAMDAMGLESKATKKKPHDERMAETKNRFPRAYEGWTDAEDARLLGAHSQNTPVADLAKSHQRQPSAIRSRLAKLISKDL